MVNYHSVSSAVHFFHVSGLSRYELWLKRASNNSSEQSGCAGGSVRATHSLPKIRLGNS